LTVLVGKEPNQQRFSIHESIICAQSDFFLRAMSGNWLEQEDRLVKFPEDDPEIFAIYINLVYTEQTATSPSVSPREQKTINDEYVLLAKLYVLAEKLQDKLAKNIIIMAIGAASMDPDSTGKCYIPGPKAISTIYDGTSSGSLARKLMVAFYTSKEFKIANLVDFAHKLPKDFFVDLAVACHPANGGVIPNPYDLAPYLEEDGK
jgi:hypothetical protein